MEKYRISFKNVYRIQHVSVLITRLQKKKEGYFEKFHLNFTNVIVNLINICKSAIITDK